MRRLLQLFSFALVISATSLVFAVDFSGSWSGEVKKLGHWGRHHHHPPVYGDMAVDLTQGDDDRVTGAGTIVWDGHRENPNPLEFEIDAAVDHERSILFFHQRYHGQEKWGFGVMTEVDGQEAIAGTLYRKRGYHHHTESADYTLFRAD